MVARLRQAYPLKLELLPLLLVALGVYLVVASYSDLPARIPVHFNAAGDPDRWGSRGMLLLLVVAQVLLVYLNTTFFSVLMAVVADFRQGEAARATVLRLLFWVKTLAAGLLTYLLYQGIQVAQARQPGIGSAWWLFLVALALLSGYFLLKLWRMFRREA